ncbi:hypothetical protein F53441_8428 [Fusarium austroafricanum]|uniref:Uncharacterized protein n=1 Tax=Fusarium austroafricanum TaxID=2364996 RepID=A0A8H4P4N0_9HYPO|nr:hypothetical protein F53441_8428 [Fusarium austroafricanum]
MDAASLEALYNGPETEVIFKRSLLKWRSVLIRARSLSSIPPSSLDLSRCLGHIPSLPDTIPRDSRWIEGYSTWRNIEPQCDLGTRTELPKKIFLTKRHLTSLSVSSLPNFQIWDKNANNGIALLTLGWSYILSAALGERQGLPLVYCQATPSSCPPSCPSTTLDLRYASPAEQEWWRAITARGVDDIGIEIKVGDIGDGAEASQGPPSALEAACYLARLCDAYGLGSQASAALSAALTIPLHADVSCFDSSKIELPRPTFATHAICPPPTSIPTDFNLIGHLMTLSLSPWVMGPALWSVFWDPDVPCNTAGAWVLPIADALQPLINQDRMDLLAKGLSFTTVAPLWLGLAICGRQIITNCIYSSLAKLLDYPFFRPDIDAAAWTGTAQSFLDCHQTRPCHDGMVSRADVWRLRHSCSQLYEDNGFSYTPAYGWPPFGQMRVTDVELEIRDYLTCSHDWTYSHWTWSLSDAVDHGFSVDVRDSRLPKETVLIRAPPHNSEMKAHEAIRKNSEKATKSVFWWCSNQVEKGFGQTIVPRRFGPDKPLEIKEGGESMDPKLIQAWLQTITT